jgi:hypothetical protein
LQEPLAPVSSGKQASTHLPDTSPKALPSPRSHLHSLKLTFTPSCLYLSHFANPLKFFRNLLTQAGVCAVATDSQLTCCYWCSHREECESDKASARQCFQQGLHSKMPHIS